MEVLFPSKPYTLLVFQPGCDYPVHCIEALIPEKSPLSIEIPTAALATCALKGKLLGPGGEEPQDAYLSVQAEHGHTGFGIAGDFEIAPGSYNLTIEFYDKDGRFIEETTYEDYKVLDRGLNMVRAFSIH